MPQLSSLLVHSTERNELYERFSKSAKQVVVNAQEEARRLMHNYLGTEHLLLGILKVGDDVPAVVLFKRRVTYRFADKAVKEIVGVGDKPVDGRIPFTPRLNKVFEWALREALADSSEILPEHLLRGIIREGGGVAVQVLEKKIRNLQLVVNDLPRYERVDDFAIALESDDKRLFCNWADGIQEQLAARFADSHPVRTVRRHLMDGEALERESAAEFVAYVERLDTLFGPFNGASIMLKICALVKAELDKPQVVRKVA